jgi:hypothetical protein
LDKEVGSVWSKEAYSHRRDEFKSYCEMYLSKNYKVEELAGLIVQVTGIPIVICYEFVLELYGSNSKIENSLNVCKKFYGIKQG